GRRRSVDKGTCGRVFSSVRRTLRDDDVGRRCGWRHPVHRYGEVQRSPARSQTPCTYGSTSNGNREIAGPPRTAVALRKRDFSSSVRVRSTKGRGVEGGSRRRSTFSDLRKASGCGRLWVDTFATTECPGTNRRWRCFDSESAGIGIARCRGGARTAAFSGIECGASSLAGCLCLLSVIPILCAAWALSPEARAGCGKPARPDPWRGYRVIAIPRPTGRTGACAFFTWAKKATGKPLSYLAASCHIRFPAGDCHWQSRQVFLCGRHCGA